MEDVEEVSFTVRIHDEEGSMWAEVVELPGCFASGGSLEEVQEAVVEAIAQYLSSPDANAEVTLANWEHRGDRVTVLVPA